MEGFATAIAQGIRNDRFESGIRLRASQSFKESGGTARQCQISRDFCQIPPDTASCRKRCKNLQDYAKMAQKRWEIAEANDPDIIEYGVERLGDLVRTDYFEKNAEDGAFTKVANKDSEHN